MNYLPRRRIGSKGASQLLAPVVAVPAQLRAYGFTSLVPDWQSGSPGQWEDAAGVATPLSHEADTRISGVREIFAGSSAGLKACRNLLLFRSSLPEQTIQKRLLIPTSLIVMNTEALYSVAVIPLGFAPSK